MAPEVLRALVLQKENAVIAFLDVAGPISPEKAKAEKPESIRAQFGTDNVKNAVHASDSAGSAGKEIKFFFPELDLGSLVSNSIASEVRSYLEVKIVPTLTTYAHYALRTLFGGFSARLRVPCAPV